MKDCFGSRGITVEAAQQSAKDGKEWRALVYVDDWVQRSHFCLIFVLPVCSAG